MLLTYSGGARPPTKHSLMPQPDRTARTQPRSQSLQEGALHSFTCSRICNFALTAAVGILKTQPTSISSNGASVGHRHSLYRSDLAALTSKIAFCCQKLPPLEIKCTPSSCSRRPSPGPADLGCFFRQPCFSLARYGVLYVQYDTNRPSCHFAGRTTIGLT
jgi:hypothetical protein